MTIQAETVLLGGILLLALITVESGGWFLTRVLGGRVPATPFQTAFFRAGHAHAAVLLVLGLVVGLLVDLAAVPEPWAELARWGAPIAAILMPAGFFLSAIGPGRTRPNRLIVLLWIGAACLTIGLLTAGVALLVAFAGAL
ncbi:MAG TPA: hypothetical protein VGC45_09700 [Gryllotalpicola sp.]